MQFAIIFCSESSSEMIEFVASKPTAESLINRIVFKKKPVIWEAVGAAMRVTEVVGKSMIRGSQLYLRFDAETRRYVNEHVYDHIDQQTMTVGSVFAICDTVEEAIALRMGDFRAGEEFTAFKKRIADDLKALAK